jgi:hypothetical protein
MKYQKSKVRRTDNVFVNAFITEMQPLTGFPTIKSRSKAVISEGRIVNVVSDNYGFLSNENFFLEIEGKLINSDIAYQVESINKDNRSFKVNYILIDEEAKSIGTDNDKILPMMSFTNSYDGSSKTSGTFALYRQVCSNGLHIAETSVGFSVKHRINSLDIVFPEIDKLIQKFTSTEYYQLTQKFNFLSEKKLSDVESFVKKVCEDTKIFTFETSEKNDSPSKKANEIFSIINREASELRVEPNMWLGYNAFNELLHSQNARNFEVTNQKDAELFETILSY